MLMPNGEKVLFICTGIDEKIISRSTSEILKASSTASTNNMHIPKNNDMEIPVHPASMFIWFLTDHKFFSTESVGSALAKHFKNKKLQISGGEKSSFYVKDLHGRPGLVLFHWAYSGSRGNTFFDENKNHMITIFR